MAALQFFFRDQRMRRGWSVREAAQRSNISTSKAYAIENGDDNVELETFEHIAIAFDMTPAELLRALEGVSDDPVEQAIRQRTAEMRKAVEGTPRSMWATIIDKTFDRAIDGARDMAQLLNERPSRTGRVRSPADTSNKRQDKRRNSHTDDGGEELVALSLGRGWLLATP